jgi:hypothetical protein
MTDTKFPVRDQATVAAQKARNLILCQLFIKECFFQHQSSPLSGPNYTISNLSDFCKTTLKYRIFHPKIQGSPYLPF